MRQALAVAILLSCAAAQAQNTPVGVWKTIDDDSHQEKSLVRIVDNGGVLSGKVDKIFDAAKQDAVCDKCSDERKGKPIVGLPIIDGMKQDGDVWEGGHILDPNNGKVYKARLKPIEDGKKLEVRGYLGPFFRTQTWVRAE
jgi:uncharacterized protein (DUF2147 family)